MHSIVVHDASSGNTSFTLAPKGTQALTADVYDTNNQYITPTLTWGSSSTATAGVAAGTSGNNPGTVTAVTGGTAYIAATCSYPDCNGGSAGCRTRMLPQSTSLRTELDYRLCSQHQLNVLGTDQYRR